MILFQSISARTNSARRTAMLVPYLFVVFFTLFFASRSIANVFPDLPSTGSIDVVMHPGETVNVGEQRLVAFGVPFPRNLVASVDQLRVVDASGNEVASSVQETLRWRSVVNDPSVSGVRAALFYVNVRFDTLSPQSYTVQYGSSRNLELTPPDSVKSTWVSTELGEEDVYPDGEGLSEPAVYTTLPPSWMSTAVIRTRFVAKQDSSAQFAWHLDALEKFGQTSVDEVGETVSGGQVTLVPITEKAPWLFDRAATYWDTYYKTGELYWLRAAHKASQFYAGRVNSDGRFTLATWDDPKYSFSGGLIGDLIMTGDTDLETTIRNIAEFQGRQNMFLTSVDQRSWNERFYTYWLLGALSAFEVTGDETYRSAAVERAQHLFSRAQNPIGGWSAEGGILHTKVQHDGGGAPSYEREPVMSPWMSALLADAVWRYYIHSEDANALEFLADLADSVVDHALYTTVLGGEPYLVPHYLSSGQINQAVYAGSGFGDRFEDHEHAIDVVGLIARGVWSKRKLGRSDTAPLLQAIDDLRPAIDYGINRWKRNRGTPPQVKYVMRPPRKFSWWFGTTSDLEWLLTSSPTDDGEPPATVAAPSALTANPASTSLIELSWQDNANDETGYLLERAIGTGNFSVLAELAENQVSFSDDNVVAATSYRYRVQARRGVDVSNYSNTVSVTTEDDDDDGGPGDDTNEPLGTPSDLKIEDLRRDQIRFSWKDNSSAETDFEVSRQVGNGAFRWLDRIPANSTGYTDRSVEPDTQYSYRVRAIDFPQRLASPYSETLQVTTPGNDPVEVVPGPTSLNATVQSITSILLLWEDNADNEIQYSVERAAGAGSFEPVQELPADTTTFVDGAVQSDITYRYRVQAQGATTSSTYSNVASATTPSTPPEEEPGTVAMPSSLSVSTNNANQIVLDWQDNSNQETHFEIVRSVNGSSFRWYERIAANSRRFTDRNVALGNRYAYRIRAIDFATRITSDYTPAVSIELSTEPEPVDTTDVNSPSNAQITSNGTELILTWRDNANNETNFEIARQIDGGPFRWYERLGANSETFIDKRVEQGRNYGYRIRAIVGQTAASIYTDPVVGSLADN